MEYPTQNQHPKILHNKYIFDFEYVHQFNIMLPYWAGPTTNRLWTFVAFAFGIQIRHILVCWKPFSIAYQEPFQYLRS